VVFYLVDLLQDKNKEVGLLGCVHAGWYARRGMVHPAACVC